MSATIEDYRSRLREALAAINQLKTKVEDLTRAQTEPIVIVGMACRFPGASNTPEAFFQALEAGLDAVTEVPGGRWTLDPASDDPATRGVRWGAFVEAVDSFDAEFFGISPREATRLDPQQRLLLEVAWEALESAGLVPARLMGSRTGVFLGLMTNDYALLDAAAGRERQDAYSATGNGHCFPAGRLSYTLGLQGPSLVVDTACSSSLVALHLACQSLRARECDAALVGGVNLMLSAETSELFSRTRALSPDGRCKTFDAAANGYVRGEGCGVLVLKRLSEARRDGDRILAVIRGSAVNQDGRSTGLTTPNVLAQQSLLRAALANAGLTPADIGYVETHGTGTPLGDPIEVDALRAVLGDPRADGSPVFLGAVKTNIGHLEAAAGMASMIKAIMALRQGIIPPNIHFRTLNPRIDLEDSAIAIATERVAWPSGRSRRRAGVSSFGMSGTNAHVILEEAPAEGVKPPSKEAPAYLLPLSAKSAEALAAMGSSYGEWLSRETGAAMHDVVYTASARRTHHEHRLCAVGRTREDLAGLLSAFGRGEAPGGVVTGKASGRPRVVFVFSGQGSQWAGMGRGLLGEEPVFRAKLEEIDRLLRGHVGFSLLEELGASEEVSRLGETEIAQPALFAIEVALVELLKSWGVVPDAVIGHSVGEIAAAHVSGAISLDEAVRLVALRGRIMQKATGHGAMAWVSLPAEDARKAIAGREGELSIAAVNDPASVVLSGQTTALAGVLAELGARGVTTRPLRVNYAFHSPQMEPLARQLVEGLGRMQAGPSTIPMYSTVSGARIEGGTLDAAYWGRNVRAAVDLAAAVNAALADGHRMLVEVGPHPVLLGNLQQCIAARGDDAKALPTLRRQREEHPSMLEALGALHVEGVEVDWKSLYPEGGSVVALPAYAWQRRRYWIEGIPSEKTRTEPREIDPLGDCLYALEWRLQGAPLAPARMPAVPGAPWLLLCDESGVGDRLASLLEQQGHRCVRARSGERFAARGPGAYVFDPTNPDDCHALLRDAFGDGARCRGVVHLTALDATPLEHTDENSLGRDQARGFLGATYLLQALLRRSWRDKPPLWLVTRGVARAGAEPVACVSQALLGGLGRTIALEHPEITCKRVDLSPVPHEDEASLLLRELAMADDEDQIALRSEGRYVARLSRAHFDAAPSKTKALRGDATYLITGGLGGLGLSVARWMVEAGARHLALVGRRGPSEAATKVIEGLAAAGAHVLVLQGDVAERKDVASLLERIEREAPPLRGVVHAAGVAGEPTPLLELRREAFERTIAAKVRGAWNLHALTAPLPLDFFVLYSSASSLLGLVSQASYAAANAFLDALAAFRTGRGLPGMSIQWGAFAEVGLAQQGDASTRLGEGGMGSLTPAEGVSALAKLLERPRTDVGVMRLSVRHWLEFFPHLAGQPFWSELATEAVGAKQASAPQQSFRSRIERAAFAERPHLLEGHVREHLGRILGIEPGRIERTSPFRALGVDSLMSLELRNRLDASLGLKLPATLLFTYPHLGALTEHLLGELGLDHAEEAAPVAAVAALPERGQDEPIAIVGMACRFPGGGADPDSFFAALLDGVDAVRDVVPSRWPADTMLEDKPGAGYAALLDGLDRFDAAFFGIAPREAEALDPQQRMLLEVTWEALEDAGLKPDALVGSQAGVFVGITSLDYQRIVQSGPEHLDAYGATGTMLATAAGRLSYVLGLQGPAVALDTACSSSLVALHLACQSLRNGESTMAVAGGANALLAWESMVMLSAMRALSPDGRCKTLDARANGYVRGEGCGMVVLKRLSDARRDGDRIHGVIRGSAINQDGRSTGLTAPNVLSQQALLRQALESARLRADDIGYIEMHGTGTPLGDPIEADALREVFGAPRDDGSRCLLGAVKTNIGHLESAAGVAGIIKILEVFRHGILPKNLHFKALNPRISLDGTPLVIPTENVPWPRGNKPRRAGVSSFGMSGTNAHVILEEPPAEEAKSSGKEASAYLLPISAKTPAALTEAARSYGEWLSREKDVPLGDVVYTASARRMHHEHRLAAVGATREELAGLLSSFARGEAPSGVAHAKTSAAGRPRVVFVFSGQGSQWAGMGRKLHEEEPVFRAKLEEIDRLLRPRAGFSVVEELGAPEERSRLGETEIVQPALFAIEVALAELLKSWGVVPDAVIGHSVGEIAAAHVSGALTLDEAIRLVVMRGRIMQKATGHGKMAWVSLPASEAGRAIAGREDKLSIAAVNDPTSVVLSGETAALEDVLAKLEGRGVVTRPLRVNYAFHSPQMDPLARELAVGIDAIEARAATISMYSTVTGERIAGDALGAAYWGRNVRATVDLAGAVSTALADGYRVFLEVGPHPVLLANVQQCIATARITGAKALPTLRRHGEERRAVLEALGALHVEGVELHGGDPNPQSGRVCTLPVYPWQRERYWIDAPVRRERVAREEADLHPLLGRGYASSIAPGTHVWQRSLRLEDLPYLADHRVAGSVVFPATAYAEMALAALSLVQDGGVLVIEEMSLERMLMLDPGVTRELQLVLVEQEGEAAQVTIASRVMGEKAWVRHATAKVRVDLATAQPRSSSPPRAMMEGPNAAITAAEHYARMDALGLVYGASFRGLQSVKIDQGEVVAHVRLPSALDAQASAYQVHPALLDACFQAAAWALDPSSSDETTFVPAKLAGLRSFAKTKSEVWVRVRSEKQADGTIPSVSLTVVDEAGRVLLELGELRLLPIEAAPAREHGRFDDWLFEVAWRRQDLPVGKTSTNGDGAWLVLLDAKGLGRALAARLRERGHASIEVSIGSIYERVGAEAYRLDPTDPVQVRRLLAEVFGDGRKCRGIVHLAGLDGASWEATSAETLSGDIRRSCVSASRLAQAALVQGWRDVPRLFLVTRAAQRVGGEAAPVAVSQAPLWGLGRAIALEHPALECTLLDLSPMPLQDEIDRLVDELGARDAESQVALRSAGRFVARLARTRMTAAPPRQVAIRPDATYLITGGLGGLGLALAGFLVGRGARHVALVGRSEPSPRAREAIDAMAATGASIRVVRADVSRREEVARVLSTMQREMPPLAGIVHAAAVLEDRTLLELTEEAFLRVMGAKVLGALHLHELTAAEPLDFFVCYSSAAGLLGSPGQSNYAAANACLDALARARVHAGLPGTSIAWGPFTEVGLAAAQEARGRAVSGRGIEGMSPADGNTILEKLIERPRAEVGVLRLSLRQWQEFYPQAAALPFFAELRAEAPGQAPGGSSAGSFRSTLEEVAADARFALLQRHVLEHLGRVLRLDPGRIDPAATFTSLGVDSLMSLELRNRLQQSLRLDLPSTLLFTYPTLEKLTLSLLDALQLPASPEPAPLDAPAGGESGEAERLAQMDVDDLVALLDEELSLTRKGV
ncbi:type I polyketide synthase [Polyangium sp. y55x31]|uniref:type I polyketide synthase n=1 Tax=Polyangium sp. y55x31 TaxID=3042688 RepID=UPI0024829A89|nr:type I polyketide synthase [Polyangium sp. y55x31]MDI1477096.1 SDR family NAD(P)-dependent oxidoreductase [Polyangium sp. y55x31]